MARIILKRYLLTNGQAMPEELQSLFALREMVHKQEVWYEGESRGLAIWILVEDND